MLMVQKSHSQPPGMVLKHVVNDGINLPTSTGDRLELLSLLIFWRFKSRLLPITDPCMVLEYVYLHERREIYGKM